MKNVIIAMVLMKSVLVFAATEETSSGNLSCRLETLAKSPQVLSQIQVKEGESFDEYVCVADSNYNNTTPKFLVSLLQPDKRDCLVFKIKGDSTTKDIYVGLANLPNGMDMSFARAFSWSSTGKEKVTFLLGLPESFKEPSIVPPTQIVCEY